jgi:hypothetical protein
MPNRWMIAAILLAALCACAGSNPRHWSKPGATQEQFVRDRSACVGLAELQASSASPVTGGTGLFQENVFMACMDSRGYKLDPKGNLVVQTDKR